MFLDKITVKAVEILADATARAVGTGSIVYLKLTRTVSVRSQAALDAARVEFDKLPGGRRKVIHDDAIDQARKMSNESTVDAIEALLRPLQTMDTPVPRLVVRNR
jgi:hypothetical protein